MKKTFCAYIFSTFLFCLLLNGLQAQQTYTYTGKPRFQILTTQNSATLGIINVELFPNIAPLHTRNFDSLVSTQFYDSTAFHRVVQGFVIQGGDPNTKSGPVSTWGYGQPWQPTVKAEFSVAKHERGILSAARSSNPNSATSQFFICVAAAPNLNGNYSVYGRVTSGMTTVDAIVTTPTVNGTQGRPVNKISMFVTYIGSNDTIPQPPLLTGPKNDSTEVDTNVVNLKWNKVPDGIIYHLYVSHDSLFTDTVKAMNLAQLNYNLLFLPSKTKYYWKVGANNGGHTTYSQIWHFTTAPKEEEVNTTGIAKQAASTERMVYPNPARDKVTFANMNSGEKLEITDLSGRLIFSGIATDKDFTVNFTDKARGTYLYHIWEGQHKITEGKIVINN